MAEHWKADDVLHEKSGEMVIAGGRRDGDGQAESFGSRVSVSSPTSILMGDNDDHDEAESSLVVDDPTTKASSFTTQQAEHQLDDLSPLLASLSVRTGLSKYYKEKSQSFTNLSLVTRLQDLPKKTTTYSTRMKAQRGQAFVGPSAIHASMLCHVPGPCSKIIAKKAMPMARKSNHLNTKARKST